MSSGRRNTLKRIASLAGLTAAAGLLGPALVACGERAGGAASGARFHALDLSGASYAKDFELIDTEGRTRRLRDFAGKAVVIFFGYTQCPDVCPTTLAELAQARQLLGADGQRVQGLFVTVDPERDTPEVVRAYTQAFDPSFIGLRAATPEQLRAVTRSFKVHYRRVEGKTPGSYTIDHTAASYLYDPQGRLRLYAHYGIGAQALADDLRALLHAS